MQLLNQDRDTRIHYNIKILKSGKYTECYIYNSKTLSRKENKEKETTLKEVLNSWVLETLQEESKDIDITLTDKQVQALERLQKEKNKTNKSIKKSKQKLRRTINSNLNQYKELDKFLTLTYGYTQQDRDIAYHDLKMFIKQLRRKFPDNNIKCISVMEKQNGDRIKDKIKLPTENLHWHILVFNMPYVDQSILTKWWGKGFIWINALYKYKDIAGYLVNYLGDDELLNLKNKRSYTTSKGLKKPLEIITEDYEEISKLLNEQERKMIYNVNYDTEHSGNVTYIKFENYEIEII